MSDSEPSYYEIALTNRQVLSVFVILLVCLVAAFFAGVWVGREGFPGEGRMLAEGAEATSEPTAIGELNFFSEAGERGGAAKAPPERPRREPPLAQVAEEPSAATTLLEDVGGEAPARPEPRPQPPAAGPGGEALVGELVIQVFSSRDRSQAEKLRQRLGSGGYPAFLLPEEVGGQTMYRVRVGPYSERAEAEKVADRVRREYRLDTWITQ